jgi:predicted permease
VLLILFSACANLGNLLLARGLARQREIDTRIALGAGRFRVLRQLMTENLLLALLGSAAGLVFGTVAARWLLRLLDAPPDTQIRIDWEVVAVGALCIVISAFAFGLPAALRTVRRYHRRGRARQVLVAVQVAVSCLLLIASGVLAHSLIVATTADLALDYKNMIVVTPPVNLPAVAAREKLEALSAILAALPGVDGVTAAVADPLLGHWIQHRPGLPPIYLNSVAPSYFDVVHVPILRGRTFRPGEQGVAIIGESGARRIFPNEDPIGKQIILADGPHSIVGVAKDSGASWRADNDSVEGYVPHEGAYASGGSLILHTRGDPAPLLRLIPSAAARAGTHFMPILLRTEYDRRLSGERYMMLIVGSLGGIASVLAAAGMFALVAFAVAQRTRELGIRMAIGARSHNILGELLTQNLRPTAVGVIVGTILAVILRRLVQGMVFLKDNGTVDPIGFIAGLLAFALIAAAASLAPALRACGSTLPQRSAANRRALFWPTVESYRVHRYARFPGRISNHRLPP